MRAPESMWRVLAPRNKPKPKRQRKPKTEQDKIAICEKRSGHDAKP